MGHLTLDFHWTLNRMRRSLGLTVIIVLSLGLAIGAVTGVFSVVNAFLLRPLPIDDIETLVRLRENKAPLGEEPSTRSLAPVNYFLWKEYNQVFAGVAAANGADLTWAGAGDPEQLQGAAISWDFFPLLGIAPALGRNFLEEEDQPGRNHVILLGHHFWTTRFGADPGVLGKTMILNGQPHEIVGVMAPRFRYPYDSDVWVPLGLANDPTVSPEWFLYVLARYKPGITRERATAEMAALVSRLNEQYPDGAGPMSAELSPLRYELIQGLDQLLSLISIAALFVLLIACVNVSNLLLAESLNQHTESALRLALGASRQRILFQYVSYTTFLALMGGALGTALTLLGVKRLVALSPIHRSISQFDIEPRIDLPTLGFTLLACLLVGLVLGLVPALRATGKIDLNSSLREGGRSASLGKAGRHLLNAFVVIEVAVALVLVVGAGLMVQSFRKLQNAEWGFEVEDELSFQVAFSDAVYPEWHQRVSFVRQALERLRALPGVASAGATTVQPFFPGTWVGGFNIEGKPAPEEIGGYHRAHFRTATPGYFATLGIPVLQGRSFTETDNEDGQNVAIVSDSFAERYWPGEDPIGKRLKRGLYEWAHRPWITVVGVVRTLKETEGVGTSDAFYLPYSQDTPPEFERMTFVVKTTTDPLGLIPQARRAIAEIDPNQAIFDIASMQQRLDERTERERFSAFLYGLFGVLGLALAALGIYGVLSFSIEQRHREIAVRKAVGALPSELRGLVLRKALTLTVIGLVLGIGGALVLTRFLSSLLYEISPRDPLTLALALVSIGLIALVSSFIPAWRAANVDPVRALRYE